MTYLTSPTPVARAESQDPASSKGRKRVNWTSRSTCNSITIEREEVGWVDSVQIPHVCSRKFLEEHVCPVVTHCFLLGSSGSISVQMWHLGTMSQALRDYTLESLRHSRHFGRGPDSKYARLMVSVGPCGLCNNY